MATLAAATAWATTAFVGTLMITQAASWDGARPVAATQALTPYIAVGVAIIALGALPFVFIVLLLLSPGVRHQVIHMLPLSWPTWQIFT